MPGAVVGFYGKLPARGDFVCVGLPRDFTEPWDAWLQAVLAGSRKLMGEAWLPSFLAAPVWRFALPPSMCGKQAALGLMLPSVDKIGRYFPLTFAALSPQLPAPDEAWLATCEAAGGAALERDTPPQDIAGMLSMPDLHAASSGLVDAEWWSDGSERVKAVRMVLRTLPDSATFAAMLGGAMTATERMS